MAKCVFCGKKAALGKTVNRAGFEFRACADCFQSYKDENDTGVVIRVLKAGIYEPSADLKEWLEDKLAKLKESERSLLRYREEHRDGVCPKCGGSMIKTGPFSLIVSEPELFTIQMSSLNTGSLEFEAKSCEDCGCTEFYHYLPQKRKQILADLRKEIERLSDADGPEGPGQKRPE